MQAESTACVFHLINKVYRLFKIADGCSFSDLKTQASRVDIGLADGFDQESEKTMISNRGTGQVYSKNPSLRSFTIGLYEARNIPNNPCVDPWHEVKALGGCDK